MLRSKVDSQTSLGTPTEESVFLYTAHTTTQQTSSKRKQVRLFIFLPILLAVATIGGLIFYIQYLSIQTLAPLAVTAPVCGAWQTYLMPVLVPSSSSFSTVSVLSKDDAWFVGPGSFAHWDGKNLSMLKGPDVSADEVFISDVAFSSDTDGWAVGSFIQGGESKRQSNLLSLHWDGNVWTVISMPSLPANEHVIGDYPDLPNKDAELNAVTIISKDDVWAVGSYPEEWTVKTLTLHWDGLKWAIVPSPNIGNTNNYLLSMAALSEDDLWAFGFRKVGNAAWENQPLSLRWNGMSWKIVNSPTMLTEIGSASVTSSKDLWLVSLSLNAMIAPASAVRRAGEGDSGWIETPMPHIYQPIIRSTVALASDDVWSVGRTGTWALVIHWDGKTWSEVPAPNPSGLQDLLDVGAAVKGDVWAVGWSSADEGEPVRQMITHFVACPGTTR